MRRWPAAVEWLCDLDKNVSVSRSARPARQQRSVRSPRLPRADKQYNPRRYSRILHTAADNPKHKQTNPLPEYLAH